MKTYKRPNGFSCGVKEIGMTARLNGGFDYFTAMYQVGYARAVEQITDKVNEQVGYTSIRCGWQQID